MSTHDHHHHHHHHPAAAESTVADFDRAFAAAQPDPGSSVVSIELDAREVEWELSPGGVVRGWGFGTVPGPTIEARVGDVLEVRLTNHLPEPTSIHWHGLRLPATMDGTDSVQRPVEPGQSFTYRFRLADAGTFWYHSHVNETVQMERGLYGALIVRGDDEPTLDGDRVLLLDDLKLDRAGEIAAPGWWIEQHNGRSGDVRLVNGEYEPALTMAATQVERWRVINAASARYVRLSIGGVPFRLIGTGGGSIESPVTMDDVLIAPGDRVDLAVGPFEAGMRLSIESRSYDRGLGLGRGRAQRFATLDVGPARPSVAELPRRLRTIEALVEGDVRVTAEVRFGGRPSLRHGVDLLVNGEQHHRAAPVRVGELQVWDIVNDTPMDHPFHLHGFFFQVLERNGRAPAFRSWEDTENVPARGRIRIAWMPDDRPGEWMYHCHILEHHAAGMMAHFEVVR